MIKWIPSIGFASLATAVWIVGGYVWVGAALLSAMLTYGWRRDEENPTIIPALFAASLIVISVLGVWLLVPITRLLTPHKPRMNAGLFLGFACLPCVGFGAWPLWLWARGVF